MITGNMRQAIEGVFAAVSGGRQFGPLHRSGLALGLRVAALLIVLLGCEVQRNEERI